MTRSERRRSSDSAGFTLIELLTTVTILGILSAIATNQFTAYTHRAQDARAESDLRESVTAEEAFYSENERYISCTTADCGQLLPGFRLTVDVQLNLTARDADQAFDAEAFHPKGEKLFSFRSDSGSFTWSHRP